MIGIQKVTLTQDGYKADAGLVHEHSDVGAWRNESQAKRRPELDPLTSNIRSEAKVFELDDGTLVACMNIG